MTIFAVPICVLCEQKKNEGVKSVHTEKFVCDDCIRLSNAVAAKHFTLQHLKRVDL